MGRFPATGRVALVTGAAGAIGAAVCAQLQRDGDTVFGLDVRTPANLAEARSIVADASDPDAVEAALADVERTAGPVQIFVHAAGVTGAGTVLDEDLESWRRILDVNLTSAYLAVRAVIPQMRRAGGGAIVLIASVNGRFGGSALSGPAYAVSKGGLLSFARFIAREHAADNITANAVAPGPHDTPMWAALDAGRRARILEMIPGGRGPGDPVDLAATIAHLCSPHARYINGATIDVNGGQWMG